MKREALAERSSPLGLEARAPFRTNTAADSLRSWRFLRSSRLRLQRADEASPPRNERRRKVAHAEAFDDLRLGDAVAEALALRIACGADRLEDRGNDVGARDEKDHIPHDRRRQAAWTTVGQVHHDETGEQLADALPE
jgi:hypothetical protein